ncbi:MAG: hypothetical protein AABY15_02725 [Nanoarchaeota archaeon]
MNNIKETVALEGFRVCKGDYDEVKNAFDNAKYVYFSKDGRHTRPHLAFENVDSKIGNEEHGLVFGITAYGLTVKGSYSKWSAPSMDSITTDWKKFLIDWIKEQKEDWVLEELEATIEN